MSGMMSFPFPFPFQQAMRPDPEDKVPARVRVAMNWIGQCTHKTAPQVAISDIAIDEIEGQKLSQEEAVAHAEACAVLTKFFTGKLELTSEEKKDREELAGGKGTVLRCPMCAGNPMQQPSCTLCEGSGAVMVYSPSQVPTKRKK